MERRFRLRTTALLVFVGVIVTMAVPAAGATPESVTSLRVAVNSAPPYRIIEGDGEKSTFGGLYVEIIEEAAGRAGIGLEYVEVPFARALLMMKTGDADVMLGPNRVPEREAYMAFLDVPLPREDKVFYLAPGAADIVTYKDLKGRLIAALAGAVHFPRFDSDDEIRRENVNNYLSALRMSAKSRVDAAILPELLGDYLVADNAIVVRKATFRAEGRKSYVAMSRASPAISAKPRIEAAMRGMAADGTMDAIVSRYHRAD